MEWRDEGVVLSLRKHGEAGVILEMMTRAHGRHLGLVHGGRSRKRAALLQPGNRLEANWRGRVDEGLGSFAVEPLDLRAGRLMESPAALHGLQLLAQHLRLLPERDPHPALFEALEVVVDHLDAPGIAGPVMVRFELALLGELGLGLDLTACAATGSTQELVYVSPRTGRAVSRAAGEPYKDRLLGLPAYLNPHRVAGDPSAAEVEAGFALTGHFLARHVFEPRAIPMPEARHAFLRAAGRETMAARAEASRDH